MRNKINVAKCEIVRKIKLKPKKSPKGFWDFLAFRLYCENYNKR
jgi:hypothetical protein